MKNNLFIIKSFSLLFQYKPQKLFFLFLLTLFLGFNMGFSIVLLIPFLQLLDVNELENSNSLVRFFDSLIEQTGITLSLELILITYAILLVLIALLLYTKAIYQASYQQEFTYQIRQRLFRKIILSDWPSLNSKSKHNHLQVLTEEVPKLADYYYFYLKMLTTLIMVSVYLIFAFAVSVKFTLLVLLVVLLSSIFIRKYLNKSYHFGADYVDSFNRLLKYIDDFWQTVKIAKVHNTEAFYYKKFEDANTAIVDLEYKLLKNHSLPQLLYKIAGVIILVVIVYVGYRIDHVPLASFFILIVLFGRIFPQLMGINGDLNQIFSNAASVKMVLRLDEQFEDRSFSDVGINEAINVENEIRIQNLYFSYPESEVLFSDFTAVIPANKITGIIGESGQGKTTLIDLIAGLQKPDGGQVLIDGKPLDEDICSAWKHSIGYLPQDTFFIDGTIRENLVWDSHNNISDEEIWDILKKVNSEKIVARRPQQLDTKIVNHQYYFSGGERQRLALARVLLRKPQLLLLDEATSSLDIENERQIMEVITELKSKITIIFVTHRTSTLPYFDKVLKLD